MYVKHMIGKLGEDIAVEYLMNLGYEIVDRNFSANQGEIDIIAREKDELVFIEVKSRTNYSYGKPIEAVDKRKQKHLLSTIKYYLYLNKLESEIIRIDIIEVYFSEESFNINHCKKVL